MAVALPRSVRLSRVARRTVLSLGTYFALDAVVQCVGAYQRTFVCNPVRGLSILRVLGVREEAELAFTLTFATLSTVASLLWLCADRCCDVTFSIPPMAA